MSPTFGDNTSVYGKINDGTCNSLFDTLRQHTLPIERRLGTGS